MRRPEVYIHQVTLQNPNPDGGYIGSTLWVLLSWLASSGWSLWKHWSRLPRKPHSMDCQKQGHIWVTKAPLQLHFIFVFSFESGFEKLEEEMATHSSILACEISCTEAPGGRQSLGSKSWTPLSNWVHLKNTACKLLKHTRYCGQVKGTLRSKHLWFLRWSFPYCFTCFPCQVVCFFGGTRSQSRLLGQMCG